MFGGLDPITCTLVAFGIAASLVLIIRDRKRGAAVWSTRPPNGKERLAAGLWLVAMVIAAASFYLGWRLFGNYDNLVFGGLGFVGVVLLNRLPGVTRT